MKLFSLFARKRMITLALPPLAFLLMFGLCPQIVVHADAGFITAKTWKDTAQPVGHQYALGNGANDDWQNLQDMINYAIANNEAVQFEPGKYRITQTLMLTCPLTTQQIGLRISGIAGPDAYGQSNGVGIMLDASATTQQAVMEMGDGNFYSTTIENIGLSSAVPNYGTKYGLLFASQYYSHVNVRMVQVSNVNVDFANIKNPNQGTQQNPLNRNGEALNIDNCWAVSGMNSAGSGGGFYINTSGQSYFHRISNCQGVGANGSTAIQIGDSLAGYGLEVTGFSYTFGKGAKQNTFIENDGISGCVNIKGGRVEMCDTILSYGPGYSYGYYGSVEISGIEFDGNNIYQGTGGTWVTKSFPLVDATLHGTVTSYAVQYTNTFSNCSFSGGAGTGIYPALSVANGSGDLSINYFDRCRFFDFSNKLTDVTNLTGTGSINGVVTQCRAATGSSLALSPISTP